MLNYDQAIGYLDSHVGAGVKPGLDRIRLLVETMGSPHIGYPSIHVAGTNGKTSTTRLSARILVSHGLNTGTYISPHLEVVEERFGIGNRIATPAELALAVSDVAAFADILEERGQARFTYFELTTAMAFAFFAEKSVEAAVVEVGLGGRLDATNVLDADVAVVTSIGLEHTEYLGETIEKVAAEKLAIISDGSILVTGRVHEMVDALARQTSRELGIEHRAYGRDFSVEAGRAERGWRMDIKGAEADYPGLFLPVSGRHQTINAAVSVAASEALLGRALDETSLQAALTGFTTPGRLEILRVGPLVMVDGAHNADGFEVLAASLREEYPDTIWTLVLGALADKDLETMARHVAPFVGSIVVTTPASERAVRPAEAAGRVRSVFEGEVSEIADPIGAVEAAVRSAGEDGAVLVAGSLYLVGAVRGHLTRV